MIKDRWFFLRINFSIQKFVKTRSWRSCYLPKLNVFVMTRYTISTSNIHRENFMFALLLLKQPWLENTFILIISIIWNWWHEISACGLNASNHNLLVSSTRYKLHAFFHPIKAFFFSKIDRSDCARVIIKDCYILITRRLAIVLIYVCQTVPTSTGEPELCLIITRSTKVHIIRRCTSKWGIIKANNFTIVSLNTLNLIIGRIKRWGGVLLQVMDSDIACPITTC